MLSADPSHRLLDRIAPALLPALGLAATATIAASLALPGHPEVQSGAILAVTVAGLGFAACLTASGRRWWLRLGPAATTVLVAVLVAGTGGADSAYQDLYAVLLVASAVLKRPTMLALDAAAVVAGAMSPLLYSAVEAAYVSDLLIDLATWGLVALTARLLARQLLGATTELAESDQRFGLLANGVPAVVYRRSLDDQSLVWVSEQARTILGYEPDAFLGQPGLPLSRIPPEDHEAVLTSRRDPAHGQEGVVRYRFDRADGERIWLEDHYGPVTGPDGHPIAVLGVAFDVSARVAAEEAQRDAHEHERLARKELGRLLAAQRSFVQGISHELRTPLTSVVGFASLLVERDGELTHHARRGMLDRLLGGARRLTELVDDLIALDRIGDVDETVHPAPQDLRSLVATTVAAFHAPAHELVVDGDPGTAVIDATVVQRILRHLVGNAVRHTPGGTRVRCRVDRVDDVVRLEVEDDGPGVPTELDGRLFEPFVQGPAATESASPGVGVGLALVAALARSHGGRIWHEAPPGGGTRFVVVLRCAGDGTPVRPNVPPVRR